MDGVDLYRVQDLLGHEKFTTTQRYAHLGPGAHKEIRAAWAKHRPPTETAGQLASALPGGAGKDST